MSGLTINSSKSQPQPELKLVTRQKVIDNGLQVMQEIGTNQICKVCIEHGGSCCSGCRHLSDRVGCQLRNTSCTAWLCGFLKYMLFKTNLLQTWNDYWEQVPGQDFREDFTPEVFFIQQQLALPNLQELSEALAADLNELAEQQASPDFILTLRDKLDKNVDQFLYYKNVSTKKHLKRNIDVLSGSFFRFHQALDSYLMAAEGADNRL
ncbi:hypothetical protein ACFOLF_11770 [Paenibacillus sepulcri]|uniref:DNA mismatch repair protein n=1 Tax=Paenibacillus sepulcri TaxID=359917 RepID=A0ABS7C5Q3_9BACL|nr:hypothetical protein [Paenibacillus sepulcri]